MNGNPEKSSFSQKVEEEKKKRIHNIAQFEKSNTSNYSLHNGKVESVAHQVDQHFFEKIGINVESIRNYLKTSNDHYSTDRVESWLDNNFPDLSLNDRKEDIKNELLQIEPRKGNFDTPLELVHAISSYIKQHIKFDILNAIPALKGVVEILPSDIDSWVDPIGSMYGITPHSMQKLRAVAEQLHNNKTQEQLQSMFPNAGTILPELIDVLKSEDELKVKAYVLKSLKEYGEGFENFITTIIHWAQIEYDIHNYQNNSDIYSFLHELKTGVCRHYSLIAKKMYDAFGTELFPDSELLYVLNHQQKHAYNVLLFEDSHGEIHKQYIDITNAWYGIPLEREEKDIPHMDKEIWAASETSDHISNVV